MKNVTSLLLLFVIFACNGQKATVNKTAEEKEITTENRATYSEFIKKANGLYQTKKYAESAENYKTAFTALGGKAQPTDRYNAACSYALASNTDTAFYHLFRIANDSQYSNLGHITTDSDLSSLHNDSRWKELITIVTANKAFIEKDYDKPLVAKLDAIFKSDQKPRMEYDGILEKYGKDSKEDKAFIKQWKETDSLNTIEITKILDERGWLGKDVIGGMGNTTLFLVIQHAKIDTQLKYMPMLKDAVKKGNAYPSNLALLEDRTSLRQGKRQIYGSQIGKNQETGLRYVLPLIDPENVDKRREEVGLGPISDYVSRWNITWNVDAHKANTIKHEAANKE